MKIDEKAILHWWKTNPQPLHYARCALLIRLWWQSLLFVSGRLLGTGVMAELETLPAIQYWQHFERIGPRQRNSAGQPGLAIRRYPK